LKEEIFIVEDNDDHLGECESEEEDVDIMTLPEETISEGVEGVGEVRQSKELVEHVESESHIEQVVDVTISEQNFSAIQPDMKEKDIITDSAILTSPVNAIATAKKEDQSRQEMDDDEDWESLISFSEAENSATEGDLGDQTRNVQILAGHSAKDAQETIISEEVYATEEIAGQLLESITPNDTVGTNEIGQFVTPEINFFEDTITTDDLPTQNDNKTLSHDNTIMFCVSTEQALITSPPKRQISSLNQQDNVSFHFEIPDLIISSPQRSVKLLLLFQIQQDSTSSAEEQLECVQEKPVIT
jgi:hypothetical protein